MLLFLTYLICNWVIIESVSAYIMMWVCGAFYSQMGMHMLQPWIDTSKIQEVE